MKRILCLALLVTLGACALGPRYQVYATGYTAGPATAIAAGTRVVVVADPAAPNPLLEREIGGKVARALASRGFPTAPAESADVVVRLRYGSDRRVEHDEELRVRPGESVSVTDSTGKVIGTTSAPTTVAYEPTVEVRDLLWLTLTACEARARPGPRPATPLWIGEVRMSVPRLSLRDGVDYLIVPAVQGFGRNHREGRHDYRHDAAHVRSIRGPG